MSGQTLRLDADAAEPRAGGGELIVRVRRAALAAEDLAAPEGRVPGRDLVGVVERADGAGEPASVAPGTRVVAGGEAPCGACERCRAGISAHCAARWVLGRERDGACAERVAVPARALHAVPASVGDEAALFARETGWALLVARAVEVQHRPYVSVLGDSVAALVCAQVLAARNASVRVLGERAEMFSRCERWGVRHRHWGEVGRRQDQAVVVECTGTPAGVALACALLRPRGTLILGRSPDGACDLAPVVEGEVTVLGLRGTLLPEALDLLARGGLDTAALVGRRVRLEHAAGADAPALAGPLKTVVELAVEPERAGSASRRAEGRNRGPVGSAGGGAGGGAADRG